MTTPTPCDRVSTNAALAWTSTCSLTWPTSRTGLITGLALTFSSIPDCTNVRNPGKAASSLYGPIGRFGNTKEPVSFETACRVTPVCVCVAVISTPGKTAPVWSLTVPLICAVACPKSGAEQSAIDSTKEIDAIQMRFIFPPIQERTTLSGGDAPPLVESDPPPAGRQLTKELITKRIYFAARLSTTNS